MRIITLIALLAFVSTPLLQAKSMEHLRRSSENISINVSGLKKASSSGRNSAAPRYEIAPSPVRLLEERVVNFLKLLFRPNGDIEIATPVTPVPKA